MCKLSELGSLIMRRIDKILRSFWRQLLWLTGFTAFVFGLLYLPAFFLSSNSLTISDYIFALINPGNTFETGFSASDRHWILLIGCAGMILLGGLLVSVFNNIMQSRMEKVNDGRVYYRFKKHILIIGYNRMCINLINQLSKKYDTELNIVLQTTCNVPAVRHELFSQLNRAIESQITIILGNRTSKEDIEKLYPADAKEIFILGETGEYDHDALNIECLTLIAELLPSEVKSQKKCHVLIEYQSTYAIFQRKGFDEVLKHKIDFKPFNFHEIWAKKVFVDGEYKSPSMPNPIRYTPLDRNPIRFESEETVHLLIIDMSPMGIALGIQASHICHFPNFIRDKRKKTRITFIDANADREMNFLRGRYPALFDEIDWSFTDIETGNMSINDNFKEKFTDIEWHFVKGQVEHPLVRQEIREWSNEPDVYLTIAVCIEHPPVSIAAGLYLPEEVYTKRIPVLALQQNSHVTLALLEKDFKYGEIRVFGMFDNCFNLQESEDRLPMLINYVYDEFYNTDEVPFLKHPPEDVQEEDIRQRWSKLKTVKKWSSRYNANMMKTKQRSFDIDSLPKLTEEAYKYQIELLSEVEHNRWNIEELLMGYRASTSEEHAAIEDDINKYYQTKAAEGNDSDTVKNWETKLNTYKDIFIHDFICPYENLGKDKKRSAKEYDRVISKALPYLLTKN